MTTKVVDFLNESGGSKFTETAPRPPPCGEENDLQSNGGNSTKSSGSHKSHVSSKSHSSSRSGTSTKAGPAGDHSHSPATTPRKSNLSQDGGPSALGKSASSVGNSGDASNTGGHHASLCEDSEEAAPLGFEPEGSAANSPPYSENGTPPHLKWAENLSYLLDDSEGVELFKDFMEHEWDGGSEELQFWFACQGLKRKLGSGCLDGNITDIQKAIYKRYVRSDKVKCISKDVKKEIAQKLSNKSAIDGCIFNAAQEEVEESMRSVTYPAFLRSEYYVQYVQNYGDSPKSSQSSGSNSARPISQSGLLPVLHEDKELESNDLAPPVPPLPVINKPVSAKRPETLAASKRTETVTGSSLYVSKTTVLPYPAHVSYAPVSAQDSELQSLSSDALTDDTISVTDSSVDGYPHHLRKKHHRKAMMKSLAQQNREFRTGLHSQIIPRTEHAPKDRNVAETDPKRFAELLADKLTKVLEERESSAKVEQKLRSISEADKLEDPSEKLVASFSKPAINNSVSSSTAHNTSSSAAHNTSASFIPLMRPPEEETAESILDQHCMRIWASSHHTPSYSPPGGHHSPPPLPGKADARKKLMAAVAAANTSSTSSNSFTGGVIGQPLSFGSSPRSYHHKKRGASAGAAEFLAQSSSSSSSQPFDSGILEDRNLILLGTETHRHIHHHHHHHHSSGGGSSKKGSSALVEADTPSHSWRTSSSATEAQAQNLSSDFTLPEYAGRGRSSTRKSGVGGGSGGGISSSALRKSSDTSSNIDSGISVMFDKDSLRVPSNWSSNPANEKVMKWILDSETVQEPPTSGQDGDKSSSTHRRSHRLNQSSSTAHTPKQSSKSKGFGRSASVERSGGSSGIGTGTLGIFSSGGGGSNSSNLSSDRLQLASWGTGGSGHHHHHPVAVMPSQPFAQDPSMPLLTPPNPTTQLEEAKRRLENQQHQNSGPVSGQTGMSISLSGASSSLQARGAVLGGYSSSSGTAAPVKSKSFTGVLSKEKLRLPPSGTPLPPPHSRTLPTARTVPTDLDTSGGSQALDARLGRRVPASSSSAPTSIQPSQGDTIIGIYMGQEPIPYRHQLSGRTITLAQIRTLVTKRGPFKYYFKRPSDEFGDGAGAVFEEISDESAVVPMFQGKIVVKVEKLDS